MHGTLALSDPLQNPGCNAIHAFLIVNQIIYSSPAKHISTRALVVYPQTSFFGSQTIMGLTSETICIGLGSQFLMICLWVCKINAFFSL